MNTNFEKGEVVVCLASGEAYDGGNRVFKGKEYEVVEVVPNEPGVMHDHANGETQGGGLIVKPVGETDRKLYPYVWKFLRFQKKVVDTLPQNVRVCADEYTW